MSHDELPPQVPTVKENAIVRLALVRPITMLMVFASILVLGFVAVMSIPLELIPSGFAAPVLSIQVDYGNATAEDVEERITIPLEQAVATTPAIDQIIATSTANGSRLTLLFEQDADMDVAYRDVRDRVARVRAELPTDVRTVNIRKQSADAFPVAFYGVRWPEALDDAQDRIEKHFVQPLERVDGVGAVNAWGKQKRQIRIEVDRELAEAANLNIFEVAQKLQKAHFNLASGEIHDGGDIFLIRSLATFSTKEQLEETIVGKNDLRLRDVARVVYDYPEVERYDRYNGQPTMAVFIVKESQANTVEVCDRVKVAIEEARRDPALAAFDIEPIFVQGDTIRTSLKQVTDSGWQGGLLAILVLVFFLQRFRLTVVIAASIPLSIFMSLPFMYFSGQSINLVSLIGLMICIGLVVDNSVVVAENIARYRQRGVGRFAAALHGTSEVALPITLATSTTMVVFLPIALMSSGVTRFFMIRMVTPVCVSLLASLFVALVLIPMAAAYVYDRDPFADVRPGSTWDRLRRIDLAWKRVVGVAYDATFGRIAIAYGRLLRASLRRRMDVVLASLVVLGSVAYPMMKVPVVLEEGFGGRQFTISYTIPANVSLEDSYDFFRDLETWFDEHRGEYKAEGQYIEITPGYATIQVFFGKPQTGDPPYKEQGQKIFEALPCPPGWEKRARNAVADGGNKSTFPIAIYGDDHKTVQEVREGLETRIRTVPGVVSVVAGTRDTSRREELALGLDRGVSERFGVSAGVVANTIAYALRGQPLPRFYTDEREIDVWIRYEKADREELSDLLEFKVPGSTADPIAIRNLTTTEVRKGEAQLVRYDKRVADKIEIEIDPDDRQATLERLQKFLREYDLPEGVSFDADEQGRAVNDSIRDFMLAALLGCIFIFLLMGFLFESVVLPLSVMPSVPLSFVGVWWFLWFTDERVDSLAFVGVLLLLGVVVNNAIVLIDFVNEARRSGLSREDAIVSAGLQRFRPIFMTSLTTVGGMLPLAFAAPPEEGIGYAAFGKTLVGGMTSATILTLIVVPVFYTMFDDLRVFSRIWVSRLVKRGG